MVFLKDLNRCLVELSSGGRRDPPLQMCAVFRFAESRATAHLTYAF